MFWLASVVVLTIVASTGTGQRLAARFIAPEGPRANVVQSPAPGAVGPLGSSVTVAADLSGHFVVHPSLDGRRVRMLVDTGASLVALSYEDARAAGLYVSPGAFTRKLSTANGMVEAAPVQIREIRIGGIVARNVEAVVLPQGRLGTSLLGMSFLKRLGGFEIARGRLILKGA
jgi:aspartyl protease family protein